MTTQKSSPQTYYKRFPWHVRDLLTLIIMSVVISMLLVGANFVAQMILAALGAYSVAFATIPYGMLALLPMAMLRRPGVAVVAGLIAGFIWLPFGGGWVAFLSGIIVGITCEMPFIATYYRTFRINMFMVAAAFSSLTLTLLFYPVMEATTLALPARMGLIVLIGILAAVISGCLSVFSARALACISFLSCYNYKATPKLKPEVRI